MNIEPSKIEKYFEECNEESKVREFKKELTEEDGWGVASSCVILSEDFIREFWDKVNWSAITCHQKMSLKFIREFKDKIIWDEFVKYGNITREILESCGEYIDWSKVILYNKIDEDIIEKHWHDFKKADYEYLLKFQTLSEKFLKKRRSMYWNIDGNISSIFVYQKHISREFKRELLLRHRELFYDFLNEKYNKK